MNKRSNRHLEKSLSILKAGTWELDFKTQNVWRTLQHDKIFGYTKLENKWTFDTFFKHVIPEDFQRVKKSFADAISNNEDWHAECRIKRVDSSERWILVKGYHGKQSKSGTMFGIIQDITDEKELINSEQKYRALYENAPLSYQSLNSDGTFKEVNPAWLKTLGYTKDEVINKYFSSFLHPDCKGHFKEIFPAFKTRGYVKGVEFKIRHKLGHYIDISFNGCIGYNPDGSVRQTYCVIQDISKQKQSELALYESQKRLSKAEQFGHVGNWSYNAQTKIITWSDGMYYIFNRTPETTALSYKNILSWIYSEDRNDFALYIKRMIENEIQKKDNKFRIILPDSSIQWIKINSECQFDNKEKSTSYFGSAIQITELKNAEIKIRDSQIFNETLLNSSPDIIYIYDISENKNVYSNKKVEQILGYTIKELKSMGNQLIPQLMHKDDFENYKRQILPRYQKLKDGEQLEHEYRMKHKNGKLYWFHSKESIFEKFPDGKVKLIFGIMSNITTNKNSELKLRESEERFRTISENAPVLINSFDENGKCSFWNNYCKDTFGWTIEELKKNKNPMRLFYPDTKDYEMVIRTISNEADGIYRESSPLTKDGRRLSTLWANFKLPSGQVFGMGYDITEQKKAEAELNKSNKLLEKSQSIAKVGGWELDIISKELYWTAETYILHDTSPEEFNPTVDAGISCYLPESREIIKTSLENAIKKGIGYDLELKLLTTKGRLIQVRTTCNVTIDNDKPVRLTGIFQDITDQKKMIYKIESLAKFPSENPNPVLRVSNDGLILYANKSAEQVLNFWKTSIGSNIPPMWLKNIKKSQLNKCNRNVKEDIYNKMYVFSIAYVKGENYTNLYARDISEQDLAEKSLLKLKTAIEKSEATVVITNETGDIEYTNPYFTKLTGYKIDEVLGKNPNLLNSGIHKKKYFKEMWDTIKSGRTWEGEFCNKKKNGDLYWEKAIISPIQNEKKIITNYVAIKTDISEDKKMEEQLRQSQKMEAIGQLAGGIAHDFNNILTGIMGCSEIIYSKVADNEELSHFVNLIMDTSMQAAELTQKLLSFSRKGESVYKIFDIHESITKTCSILERSIDKSIKIISKFKANNSLINGDKSLIENSLLNLGINARDVMPKGGELKFVTNNVTFNNTNKPSDASIKSGEYIEIDVQDTGTGMSKEVQERLFEPFFTTKTIGQGTGLGLSIVYNTIKENKGFIDISSELGHGSIFKLFLPLSTNKSMKNSTDLELIHGKGTILVADDENIVRLVSAQILRELGYDVITVSDGEECINMYNEKRDSIDLIILDMIMPKMNGKNTFYSLKSINKDIKIIICSGFSKDINIKKLISDGLSGFIQKPFKKNDLSIILNNILNNSS